jgi:hypothetical protein
LEKLSVHLGTALSLTALVANTRYELMSGGYRSCL